ncbi:DNA methyltransferase [Pseudomonas sp. WP18]|uniref:DNA-methyltransferase n=1 Tax=Pseudomonas sp. WP18 TaxID=3118752 RepID=UPI0030D3F3B0
MSQQHQILVGDCLDLLRKMPDNSVDSIVTDPPYGLSFMGKKWDYDVPAVEVWVECLRVLKPGGHLLAFAGTRTQHRMAVRIEDAGFEIRDMIAWVYGSGFPKSMDVSKAIDKAAGAEREVIGVAADFARDGAKRKTDGSHVEPHEQQGGHGYSDRWSAPVTAAATDAARQWDGWGTALKPALEPITVARKPLIGTVAANVLAHGTGALNIDACRVATEDDTARVTNGAIRGGNYGAGGTAQGPVGGGHDDGRWPANLIHDGSAEVVALFPVTTSGGGPKPGTPRTKANTYGDPTVSESHAYGSTTGNASRFFYAAKASRKDRNDGLPTGDQKAVSTKATMRQVEDADWSARNGNHHPTVKPTDLMAYLLRLVTPAGGVALDPFMGSGSTGKAAMREGFQFIGCEIDEQYVAIARARIEHEITRQQAQRAESDQLDLFGTAR